MRRLVVFGKGGIGKSTVSSNLATLLCKLGFRVLQVGCDPKHDSYMKHGVAGKVTTVMDAFIAKSGQMRPEDLRTLVVRGETGVHIIETGGPEPGRGCAGRAVSIVLEVIKEPPALTDDYDIVLFDVLGDVVCGGFSAPIRDMAPSDIILLVSHEYMSLYAANNIARGLENLSRRGGARLIGVVGNKIQSAFDAELIARFASSIGSNVLGSIPFDHEIVRTELDGTSILSAMPDSLISRAYEDTVSAVLAVRETDRIVPKPLDDDQIRAMYKDHIGGTRTQGNVA